MIFTSKPTHFQLAARTFQPAKLYQQEAKPLAYFQCHGTNGIGTRMMAFNTLKDEQIWQIVS